MAATALCQVVNCNALQVGLKGVVLDEAQRLLLLQMALKCADMGHIAEEQDVHMK